MQRRGSGAESDTAADPDPVSQLLLEGIDFGPERRDPARAQCAQYRRFLGWTDVGG